MANSGFPPTQQPERRKSAVTHEDLEEGRRIMAAHFDERFDSLEKLIRDGFPNGDPGKHREVHERYISEAAERKAFWKGVFEKVATGGIYAAVVAVAMAVWQWIKSEAHK